MTSMQTLWDRAMLIARTRGAYGDAPFPSPDATFPLPQPRTMLHDLLFVCTATDEEYDTHLAAVRADMEQWKARVRASRGKLLSVRETAVDLTDVDLTKVEFTL